MAKSFPKELRRSFTACYLLGLYSQQAEFYADPIGISALASLVNTTGRSPESLAIIFIYANRSSFLGNVTAVLPTHLSELVPQLNEVTSESHTFRKDKTGCAGY